VLSSPQVRFSSGTGGYAVRTNKDASNHEKTYQTNEYQSTLLDDVVMTNPLAVNEYLNK
jgi:hypothetical protein